MKRLALTFVSALFLVTAAFPLTSQAQFKVGPRATISLGDLSDAGADFAVGADVRYDLSEEVDAPIQLDGAFDYYFADDQQVVGSNQSATRTIFTVDLNVHYMFPVEGTVSPYAGAGIGITSSSTDDVQANGVTVQGASTTDTGLNLVGGAEFNAGSLRPFVQGQFTVVGDIDRFGITGGLLFYL
jgi:opacity protein-like surface antigen